MNNQIINLLATDKRLTGTHIRVYLIMSLEKPLMQSRICKILSIKKQNVNKVIKELETWGYISIHHIEGRNKYLKSNTNAKLINSILNGQESFNLETIN